MLKFSRGKVSVHFGFKSERIINLQREPEIWVLRLVQIMYFKESANSSHNLN